ncbi:MAG TPA: extracellular solute-binding protein [Candidatus Omnitrophota bacterium]|nr:extracellular solute-binding protein [Candidatus Omnitrophota bacterium]
MKGLQRYCLAAFVGLLVCWFVGCSSKPQDAGKLTLTVWHWMTDREPAFQELAKRYLAKTGVKVNFELYAPSDAYSQKVRAAAQGENLPDIFGILGEKRDFASFIKAEHVLGLTSYMEENNGAWKNSFFSHALAVNEFPEGNRYGVKPGIYGVPIDVMNIQMLYNKKLFKELGLNPKKPPTTFTELLEIGKKIKQANMQGLIPPKGNHIQGLVSGWGEIWMIDCLASNYAFNIMGRDKVLATIKGDVPYTDAGWIKVFSLFKEMQDSGVLATGIVTMINKTAEQLFANDKAVFAFNGSWCVNVYKGMNPQLDYAAILPPRVSENYPMAIWGGAGSSFMASARSKNKEEAVKFLKWLSDKKQQAYLSEATNNLPANKESISKIPEILAQFSDDMESTTHPNVWGVSEFPAVIEALDKGIQSIIIAEKTPEQIAQEVQKIKERELAKKR